MLVTVVVVVYIFCDRVGCVENTTRERESGGMGV